MSADNGIYILQTPKNNNPGDYKQPDGTSLAYEYEYRVRELGAIDNISWDEETSEETDNPDVQIKNARQMWNKCTVFTSKEDALKEASIIEDRIFTHGYWTEYGICFIRIQRVF